jgi:hypothetical protein
MNTQVQQHPQHYKSAIWPGLLELVVVVKRSQKYGGVLPPAMKCPATHLARRCCRRKFINTMVKFCFQATRRVVTLDSNEDWAVL